MSTVAQRSFSGGEVGPAIYPHCDMVKYSTGARQVRNFFVRKHGGLSNRPGTSFIAEVKDSTKACRIIPYRYTDALTYIMQLGPGSRRMIHQSVPIRKASQAISAVTNANPCKITYVGADNYANDDHVYIDSIVGPIGKYLNGRTFIVAGLNAGANTFTLKYLDGTAVNSTLFGAYTSGGTVAVVFEIPLVGTPTYAEDELFDIQYAQSSEILTLVHPSHPVDEISGTSALAFASAAAVFGPALLGPEADVVKGAAGALSFRYVVTSVANETFEESLVGVKELSRTIDQITNAASGIARTTTNHGFAIGDVVYISKANFASAIIDQYVTITAIPDVTHFTFNVNTTTYGAFSLTAPCWRLIPTVYAAATPTVAAPNVISWVAVSGARQYNVYKERQGIWCFHGTTATTSYNDEGGNGDANDNPPENRDIFNGANKYPGVVGTVQQRRAFGRPNNELQSGYCSKTALPENFTLHFPVTSDDSIKFKLAGEKNELRHIIDLGTIVLLTAAGEWTLQGDPSGILTPSQINPKQVGYNGSSKIKPVLINKNALFVQARGNIIRDLGFDFSVDGYKGNDLTIFASHLFEGYTIVDWAYQQTPNSIVWAVRSDGVLLGLTYLKEQDIWAWHRHDTDGGLVESVCAVSEGAEDFLYLVVKRTINGATKRYIERMNTRVIDDVVDNVFMDCAKSFDGRHTGTTTMTMSGSGWTYQDTLTLTASAATFSAADVGKAVHLTAVDGTKIRFTIDAYTSATVVTGRPHKTVVVALQGVAIGNGSGSWALAITELTGLWHLEGQNVSIFADGFVVASPNNDQYAIKTVANGIVTLDRPYAVIQVGIPITADIETLDIDTVQGETLADKKKLITRFTAWFEASRGLFSGARPPEDDDVDPLQGLFEMKMREQETSDEPVDLFTGTRTDLIQSEWNSNGRVFIRQVDPVPLTVLAIAPGGMIPFRSAGA